MFENLPQKNLYYKTLKEQHTGNKTPIQSLLKRLADLCGLKWLSLLDLALLWGII